MLKKIFLSMTLIIGLFGCQKQGPISDKQNLKIAIASDLHYFAKKYYEQCDWFEESLLYGDGKMVTSADEIIDTFIADMLKEKVDFVVLTGDLSFNGEVDSHKELAKKLMKLEEHNIHVAVINGNHDVDNIYTKGYGKDDYFEVDNVNGKEFKEIYQNLGYNISSSEHNESLSYQIHLNDQYDLLLVDTNMHEMTGSSLDAGGNITSSTQQWLTDQLEEAKNNHKIPIIAMHHNLGIHNEYMSHGYTINNYTEITKLFKTYQVPVIFSGHIHLQDIMDVEGIKEITSSSLLDNPLQYGIVELSSDTIEYHTQSVKISKDSGKYFDTVSNNKFYEEKNDDESKLKRDVMVIVNHHYFAGTIKDVENDIKKMPGYSLILKEEGFYKQYLESMMKNNDENTKLEIHINK